MARLGAAREAAGGTVLYLRAYDGQDLAFKDIGIIADYVIDPEIHDLFLLMSGVFCNRYELWGPGRSARRAEEYRQIFCEDILLAVDQALYIGIERPIIIDRDPILVLFDAVYIFK